MATLDSIFICESGDATTLTVNATTCSAVQAAGENQIFAIIGTGEFHIKFGDADTMADASASSMRIPGDAFSRFDMGKHTHFKVFNPGGAAIKVQWIRLSRS